MAAELASLLNRLSQGDQFLGASAATERDALLAHSLDSREGPGAKWAPVPGDRLGAYQLEHRIGEGMRSVVYLASREEDDWQQQVAIKVLTRGFNIDDVYRRFLSERQILTELHHPHITTLLDGGVSEEGLPYFVMEFIDGLPITEYCKQNRLDRIARVRLFQQVCKAVSHAHRHLVVHRDIKPSNILVSSEGVVKLLDFGIAKLLEPLPGISSELVTEEFSRPMTVAYSSPEQLSGGLISTATDVYQLGLLLAEMLTEVHPIREAMGLNSGQMAARPPSKVNAINDDSPPYALRDLRGDLDWITLKALEPEPDNRYDSAAGLLSDIENFLQHRPVSARTATLPYLARKLARRRPGLSLAIGLAFTAVLGYGVLLAYFNVQISHQRTAALEAAERAEEIKDLLVGFILSPDPFQGMGVETLVSDLLENAEQVVNSDLVHRPELQAELLGTLADTYLGLSIPHRSAAIREQEIALRTKWSPNEPMPLLQARRKLASALLAMGNNTAALAELEQVHSLLASGGPEVLDEFAKTKAQIGSLHAIHGAAQDASIYLDEAIRLFEASGNAPLELAEALYRRSGQSDDYALRQGYLERAHQIHLEHQGNLHPDTLIALATLAANLTNLNRFAESLEIYNELIPILTVKLGASHEQVITIMNNRAVTYFAFGDHQSAAGEFRKLLELNREKLGDVHRDTAESLQNLGAALNILGDYEEAIIAVSEAARIFALVNLPGNFSTAYPHITLANIHAKLNQLGLMQHHAESAIGYLTGNVPETNIALLLSRCLLGDSLIRQGKSDIGVPLVKASLKGLGNRTGVNEEHLNNCQRALGRASQSELNTTD